MSAQNQLLAALSQELYESLAPHLKLVSLSNGAILHHPNELLQDLYFPLDCLISITVTMQDGSTVEASAVGSRDVAGVNAFMGSNETTQTEYIVQSPGEALKIDAAILRQEFNRSQELRDLLLRYTQVLIAQISQTAACNRLHVIEQRLARWLLEVQDRLELTDFSLTQEFMSQMLGVRRAGVTQAAQKLQENNLIRYSRGRVYVLDQQGLEAASCECFKVIKGEYDRLLGSKQP